jgi:hypothetical protein
MKKLLAPAIAVAVVGALYLLPVSAVAAGSVLTVQGTADDSGTAPCTSSGTGSYSCPSLRDAIDFADAGSAGTDPTIALGSGTYGLNSDNGPGGPLAVTAAMTITGGGASATTIDQMGFGAVITVTGVSSALTLNGLEVTGGDAIGGGTTTGAGIGSAAPLTLDSVTVTNNDDTSGGSGMAAGAGIYASDGLTISNSTVSTNYAHGALGGAAGAGGEAIGAGIWASSLTMSNTTVTGNDGYGGSGGDSSSSAAAGAGGAAVGAGIFVSGPGTITGSTITGNEAAGGLGGTSTGTGAGGAGGMGAGAGVAGGSITLDTTQVATNVAAGGNGGAAAAAGVAGGAGGVAEGGGVFAYLTAAAQPASTISQSTIDQNQMRAGNGGSDPSGPGGDAGGADGGGVADGQLGTTGSGVPLRITADTITANTEDNGHPGTGSTAGLAVDVLGGGIAALEGATLGVVNSTVYQNGTGAATGSSSDGDGVAGDGTGTTVTLANDTIDANYNSTTTPVANEHGTGLFAGDSATVELQDTIIADGAPSTAAPCGTVDSGAFSDAGHNLEGSSPSTCGLSASNGDVIGESPQLPSAGLSSNGGPTQTLAPASGSPVIGAGGACTDLTLSPPAALTVDQRGEPRTSVCTIGALQTEAPSVTGAPSLSGSTSVGSTLTCSTGTFKATGDGPLSSSGQVGALTTSIGWLLNGAPISGATGGSYTVATADQGSSISCQETATGAYGTASAKSNALAIPAPSVTALTQSHARWREAGKKGKHEPPIGTTFTVTLSEAASVTFVFTEAVTGRKVKVKGRAECIAATKHNSHKPHCTLKVPAGAMTVAGRAGANAIAFDGKVGPHKLKSGRYSVTVTAVVAGKRSNTKTLSFKIVT